MQQYKLVILRNELETDHLLWIAACRNIGVSYRVVDLTASDWFEEIQKEPVDYLLAIPGAISPVYKQLYDERIQILVGECHFPVYPTLPEILIYENKRYLAYWLKANSIPSPRTWVFYQEDEMKAFLQQSSYPLVAKLNIGASGSGVTVLHNREEAERYCHQLFIRGIKARSGPRLFRGNIFKRIWKKLCDPILLKDKIARYKAVSGNIQRGFILLQEFIPHTFEWRAVRIGDSFFAHKKLLKGEKASGSLLKNYDNPPQDLFDFIKELTDRFNFRSQAIDLFETEDGKYLVNEMQCIFGQSDPYQMLVDGKPGRYVFKENTWVFEPGDFNSNESYNLRVQDLLNILNKNNEN